MDYDQAIIDYGAQQIAFMLVFKNVSLVISVLLLLLAVITLFAKTQKQKQSVKLEQKERETNPFHEESRIVMKLENLQYDTSEYSNYAPPVIKQIHKINDIFEDFDEVTASYDYPIITSVRNALIKTKLQMLENTKSITNRIVVNGGLSEIEQRIAKNDDAIKQAHDLVIEAVNYVDNKTPQTQVRLESLTESLQELNKTLN